MGQGRLHVSGRGIEQYLSGRIVLRQGDGDLPHAPGGRQTKQTGPSLPIPVRSVKLPDSGPDVLSRQVTGRWSVTRRGGGGSGSCPIPAAFRDRDVRFGGLRHSLLVTTPRPHYPSGNGIAGSMPWLPAKSRVEASIYLGSRLWESILSGHPARSWFHCSLDALSRCSRRHRRPTRPGPARQSPLFQCLSICSTARQCRADRPRARGPGAALQPAADEVTLSSRRGLFPRWRANQLQPPGDEASLSSSASHHGAKPTCVAPSTLRPRSPGTDNTRSPCRRF